jgi:papain like cysteine protease AvrRpt2
MGFSIQTQQQDKWCWAAVSVSLEHYFVPTSTLTQGQMATEVLGIAGCSGNPGPCNQAARLQDALDVVRQRTASGPRRLTFPAPRGRLTFSQLEQELDGSFPVCVRIGWDGGGGHFVVLSGYQQLTSGGQLVDVADPFYGDGTITYDELSFSYAGRGRWTATYPVRV